MMTIRLSYTLKDLKNANSDILNSNDLTIEILNTDYKDIDSLRYLDITNIVLIQCGKHVKNCALQNVFKIYW